MRFETGVLRSRVAKRLFALFLLTALVPVVVSAWLSRAAVGDLSQQIDTRMLGSATRQAGLQVFDRLMLAKGLMQSWPAPALQGLDDAPPLPGLGLIFRAVVRVDAQGQARAVRSQDEGLAQAWARHVQPAQPQTPSQAITAQLVDAAPLVRLYLLGSPGGTPRVVLTAGPVQGPRWLAELEVGYLWSSIADDGDASWSVSDLQGQLLAAFRAEDTPQADVPQQQVQWPLFLDGEFGAPDWVFIQRRPQTQARWAGQPLALWLALVVGATVLGVALLSIGQIRRTLVPLEQLTEGTRRLAAGDASARVAAPSTPDEFGDLALAFNHMAGRIERQWQSLQALAEIDRDILQRSDIRSVAARAVGQLCVLQPGACAALLWLDDPASLALQGLLQRARDPRALALQIPLTPVQQHTLLHTTDDLLLSGPELRAAGSTPWMAPGCRSRVVQLLCLPVRWGGQTQAVILVGLRRLSEREALQPALDLRERLAVAFTARERDRALEHRALHDSLTGLANRHGLHERLDQMLAGIDADGCALFFIDLDRFKQVNDTHGHAAGDDLLRQAARRLTELAPAEALVARPGGDEFIIAWPGALEAEAAALGTSICAVLAQPFQLRGTDHFLGASVGVALAPHHAISRDELMRHADLAMYAAKAEGRGRCRLFAEALDTQLRERLQLQRELRHAIDHGELVLYYQPRVRPADGRITSAEALVRWRHPRRGLLYPGDFVPLAEESDLIEGLGNWVLDAACAQMALWRRQNIGLARVSVNVSPRQLISGDLVNEVRRAMARHGVPAEALELEVTESLLVGDASAACEQLAELRSWGLTIALDDFGTGYSSMSTLRQLPIDVMKVDRSFVMDLGRDESALAVTRAILALAQSLHMHTVAEGIETEAQAAELRALGCDELQGYLYAKPLPPEAFVALPGLVPATSVPEPALPRLPSLV